MHLLPPAFKELEKALAVGARRLLQLQEQVERAGEEEKRSLQQELTRVKQEVVTIMKVRHIYSTSKY